jgi:WD40 repeat protein
MKLTGALIFALPMLFGVTTRGAELLLGDWGNKAGGVNDVILKIDSSGVLSGNFAAGGGLDAPTAMAYGPDSNLYVTSAGSDSVIRFDGSSGAFQAVVTSFGLDFPTGLAFGPDHKLYVSNPLGFFANSVLRYDSVTGAFIDVFASNVADPGPLTFGQDGNLYVISGASNSILRLNGSTGASMGTFASGGLFGPKGLAFGPDGNLYVVSSGNNVIRRFDSASGASLGVFSSVGLDGPAGLTFGPDSNLYVASSNNHVILRYDGITGAPAGVFSVYTNFAMGTWTPMAFRPNTTVPEPSTLLLLTIVGMTAAVRKTRMT